MGIEILITRDENLPLIGIDGWVDACTGTAKIVMSRARAMMQAEYRVLGKYYLENIG